VNVELMDTSFAFEEIKEDGTAPLQRAISLKCILEFFII